MLKTMFKNHVQNHVQNCVQNHVQNNVQKPRSEQCSKNKKRELIKNMSFLKITDPKKRDFIVNVFLKTDRTSNKTFYQNV